MATYTMQELELETAELLPARETLCHATCGYAQRHHVAQAGRSTSTATTTTSASSAATLSGNGFLGSLGGSGNGASCSACPTSPDGLPCGYRGDAQQEGRAARPHPGGPPAWPVELRRGNSECLR